MDFSLSEEQALLQDSVVKYLESNYDFEQRQQTTATDPGFSREHWANFAEFGWLTIPIAEDRGGYGGRVEDVAVVMEAFGRHLVVEPYLANILLAAQLIARGGSTPTHETVLEGLLDGSRHAALAAFERQSRQNLCNVTTRAERDPNGFRLSGQKVLVGNGAMADTLIVTARTGGDSLDRNGLSVFMLDARAPGIVRTTIPMMDGTRSANIEFRDVAVDAEAMLGTLGQGADLLEPVVAEAQIAICAQLLGCMDALFRKTVEYTRTREQFGVPIGSFQALQHRMVDMFMATEQSRSILYRAICEHQQGEPGASQTIIAMKALIARYARQVSTEAIQLHGGMGMTDELDIGHYVKTSMVLTQMFGNADASLRAFCEARYADAARLG